MPVGSPQVQSLGIDIDAEGITDTAAEMTILTSAAEKQQKQLQALRSTYLFLSFGLLATGGLFQRLGGTLSEITNQFRSSAEALEFQSTVVATTMGNFQKNMEPVREELIRLGVETQFTATQAGQAMQRLALAGFDATEAIGSTGAVLDLAVIGLTDVTEAADLAVGVFRGFGYEATNATEASSHMNIIVSELGHAATNSATTVSELGEALKFVAAVSGVVQLSLEEVTASLMIAADSMVRGGMAGRALRVSLLNMARAAGKAEGQTLTAEQVMEDYNLQLTDADGNLKGMADLVDEFNNKLGHLNETQRVAALRTITNTRAVTEWTALMRAGGDEIRRNETQLKAAAAKQLIMNKLNKDGTKVLIRWGKQVKEGESALTSLQKDFGFTAIEAQKINEVLMEANVNWEEYVKNVQEAADVSEAVRERLETLRGTTLLMKSSVDALWASIGQQLVPVIVFWNRSIKYLADNLNKLPKPIKFVIGILTLLGALFFMLIGRILNWVGSIFMLVAALVMLKKQMGDNINTTQLYTVAMDNLGFAKQMAAVAARQMAGQIAILAIQMGILIFSITFAARMTEKFGAIAGTVTFVLLTMSQVILQLVVARKLDTLAIIKQSLAQRIQNSRLKAGIVALGGLIVAKWLDVKATLAATAATWSFNAALYANPVVWVTIAIVGLLLVLYVLVKNLDKVIGALKGVYNALKGIGAIFTIVGNKIRWLVNLLKQFREITASIKKDWWDLGGFFDDMMGNSVIPEAVERGVKRIKASLGEINISPRTIASGGTTTGNRGLVSQTSVNVLFTGPVSGMNGLGDVSDIIEQSVDAAVRKVNLDIMSQLEGA